MTRGEFEAKAVDRMTGIANLLGSKGREYAREDAFSNFTKAAALQGCSKEQALLGMLVKHFVSVVDVVKDIDKELGGQSLKVNAYAHLGHHKLLREKTGDIIAYCLLLEAMHSETVEEESAL